MSGLKDRWFHDEIPCPDIDFQPWYRAGLFARHSCFPAAMALGATSAFTPDSKPLYSSYVVPRRFEWVAVSDRLAIPATTFRKALREVNEVDTAMAQLYDRDPQRFYMAFGTELPYTDVITVASSIAFYAERGFTQAIVDERALVDIGDIVMPLEKLPDKSLVEGRRQRLIELGRSLGVGVPLWCQEDYTLLVAMVDEKPRNGTWPVYAYTGIDVLSLLADGADAYPTLTSPASQQALGCFLETWITLYGSTHKGALSQAERTYVGVVSHGGHLNDELVAYTRGKRFQRGFGDDLLSQYRYQMPNEPSANAFRLVPNLTSTRSER